MPTRPKFEEALARVLQLTYPPTILSLPPSRALGHKLSSPIIARGNVPVRPFALADGLAMPRPARQGARPEPEEQPEEQAAHQSNGDLTEGTLLTSQRPDDISGHVVEDAGIPEHFAPEDLEPSSQDNADTDPETADTDLEGGDGITGSVVQLRSAPATNRREDALAPGEAVAVPVGGEVPRGSEFVVPFQDLLPDPESDFPLVSERVSTQQPGAASANERAQARGRGRGRNAPEPPPEADSEDDGELPGSEPDREWDLVTRFGSGTMELPGGSQSHTRNLVPIGGWARPKDELLSERTLLRAGEVALLETLGIDEVEVYRRPVVGVASLGLPLPQAQKREGGSRRDNPGMLVTGGGVQRGGDRDRDRQDTPGDLVDPVSILVQNLCRSAQVSALPFGTAPKRFRPLAFAVERWLSQVDILLLVGGSHYGPRCLAQDVIASQGELALTGAQMSPGGSISAGSINGQPVFALPGTLSDVLTGFVLFVRPLLHKYQAPLQYAAQEQVRLENGSRIAFEEDTVVPVRYGWDEQGTALTTRFSGRRHPDPWLEYIRGEALIVFEGGRTYSDGEPVTAYPY